MVDMVSRVLDTIRVRAPLLAQLRLSGDVSVDMLEGPGSPFYYVGSGDVILSVGEQHIDLTAGDLAILPTWARHSVTHGAETRPRSILEVVQAQGLPLWSMKEGLESPLFIDLGEPPYAAQVISGNFAIDHREGAFLLDSLPAVISFAADDQVLRFSIETAIALVLDETEKSKPGYSAVAARSLELLFIQVLRRWLLESEHATGWARGMADGSIRRALEAMYTDPGRDWDLQKLAEYARQSRSAFAVSFRNAVGETPFAHLRRYRMNRAAAQLRTTRKSVTSIAADLGYASTYAFIRAFREEMKMTPSGFRRAAIATAVLGSERREA